MESTAAIARPSRSATLTPEELVLLRVVRMADEDDGGLAFEMLGQDELTTMGALVARGLVDVRHDEGGDGWARINARGIEALRG